MTIRRAVKVTVDYGNGDIDTYLDVDVHHTTTEPKDSPAVGSVRYATVTLPETHRAGSFSRSGR